MSSSGEITLELVQQILKEVEKDSSVSFLRCLKVEELNEGMHAGSSLRRVTVKYTRGGDTSQHSLSLIVKAPTSDTSDINALQLSTLFPREIHMFSEILPRMSALLKRALPDRHEEFAAKGYYTRKTPSYLLAFEDLSPKGFKPPKRKEGLDLRHSSLAIKALARFHAASVMIRREDKNLFTVFDKYYLQEKVKTENDKQAPLEFISAVVHLMKSRKEFDPSWAHRLQKRYETLLEDLERLRERDDGRFNVLIHGDFAIHNVMYRHSESSGEVESFMMVDFQTCSYSSPALDLHHFIIVSANDDVRANHIDTLLREYHAELATTLKALGAPTELIISLPQLLEEFDRMMPLGLFCATCLLPILTFDIDKTSAVTAEHMSDENRETLEKFRPMITEDFLKTLKIILPIFIQKKVL